MRLLVNNLSSYANKGIYTDGVVTSPNANVVIDGSVTSGKYTLKGNNSFIDIKSDANVSIGSIGWQSSTNAVVISTTNASGNLYLYANGSVYVGTNKLAFLGDVANSINVLANTVNTITSSTIPVLQANLTQQIVWAQPPGAITAYAGNTAPTTWRECAGQAVSRTGNTASLFAVLGTSYGVGDGVTTFNLPDLRGEFIRGWDHGRGVDIGRALGASQSDDLKAHNHTATAAATGGVTPTATTSIASDGNHAHGASTSIAVAGNHAHSVYDPGHAHGYIRYLVDGTRNGSLDGNPGYGKDVGAGTNAAGTGIGIYAAGDHAHSATTSIAAAGAHTHTATTTINAIPDHTHAITVNSTGGTETRPRNVAMMYIIKL
jgi:microcystin-dependent protein